MPVVSKAVIAAAGFGTRFLPQTKAMPKEMLPVIDKPIIQYVVEELVAAGIRDIIIVNGANKRSIEDHFDLPNQDLTVNLQAGGSTKEALLSEVEAIAGLANFIYIRQKGPYGTATPIACAAHLIGDEPFIYTYADELFVATPGRTQQLIALYEQHHSAVLACKRAHSDEEYDRYGFVGGQELESGLFQVERIIEKPGKSQAPSSLASVSGYLLTPDILTYIDRAYSEPREGEFMLQPIIQTMLNDGHPVLACEIKNGTYYDTGNKFEYIKTVIDFALQREDMGSNLEEYLRKKLQLKV